jgi:hypothetical protein
MLISIVAAFGLAGCDVDEGPAEEAGESLDEAGEKIEDAGDDAANAVEDACEDAREGVDAEDSDC